MCKRCVKFGLKIPNRLGKMSEKLKGVFLTHTVRIPISVSFAHQQKSATKVYNARRFRPQKLGAGNYVLIAVLPHTNGIRYLRKRPWQRYYRTWENDRTLSTIRKKHCSAFSLPI